MNCRLTCTRCSEQMSLDKMTGMCDCGGVLLVEYDLEEIGGRFTKERLKDMPTTMWRYFDLLPIGDPESIVSLGEGWTPLIRTKALEKKLPLGELWVKREEQNPTGSFKARGFSTAISLLHERNVQKAAVPSNGNAASALAAYSRRAGMGASVFVPQDCPGVIIEECIHYGASTFKVDGFIHDAGKIIEEGMEEQEWFNVGTSKEPGRIEGKKTMGLELAEQFDWQLPDVIVYPTGGGSGVIGLWKAFHELKELGIVECDLPRIISVQEAHCQPIVDAIAEGKTSVEAPDHPVTSTPTGMRVPLPSAGDLILSILRETGGTAVAVNHEEINRAQKALGAQGISSSPEGAATWAGLLKICEQGLIYPKDRVVLFNTSHAMKYLNFTSSSVPIIQKYDDIHELI